MRESIASTLDCDETVKRQLEEYFHDLDDICEAENRLIQDPEVQKLLNDKNINTDLSHFTLLENSLANITSNKIGKSTQIVIPPRDNVAQELLTDMNLKLKMADYNLQRLLDSGEFHIDLLKGESEPI